MAISNILSNSCVRNASILAALALGTSSVQAQSFDFTLDQNQSSASVTATYGVDMDASLKGDYDATSNPTGTRTVPGLFGGSGNQDIPMDLGLSGDLNHAGAPLGSFSADLDLPGLTFTLQGLDLDFLGGVPADSDVTLDLLFSTFRTFAPDSLFLGGIPVSLPLASQSVSDFSIVQTGGPVSGILIPMAIPGHYGLSALVPASISLTVNFQGTPTPVGPIDVVVPLVGALDTLTPTPTISMDFTQAFQQTTLDPLPGFALTDMPFDAPTFLPAGNTAHLLISGSIDQVDIDATLAANLVATSALNCGFTSYCAALPNSTGLVGQLSVVGSSDVLMGDLTLNSTDLPLNVFGYYLMSPGQGASQLPAPSQGILCVGSPLYRFNSSILYSGMTGTMDLTLDFNNLPQGQVFSAGSVWNFQLWHRDMYPSNTSNTTTAVEVQFCQ